MYQRRHFFHRVVRGRPHKIGGVSRILDMNGMADFKNNTNSAYTSGPISAHQRHATFGSPATSHFRPTSNHLDGEERADALLYLSSWCLVMVERLLLVVPRGCLRFVIVVFPDHAHLLFFLNIAMYQRETI